jgi:hypothetical protein
MSRLMGSGTSTRVGSTRLSVSSDLRNAEPFANGATDLSAQYEHMHRRQDQVDDDLAVAGPRQGAREKYPSGAAPSWLTMRGEELRAET